MTTKIKCDRCARRYQDDDKDADRWNATLSRGVIVAATCPTCQTAEENVEAAINASTLEYGTNDYGRVTGKPKGVL